ncbi:MAG: orotate phosphoribosyltransferase [Actinobacteria bacterium]|nr:orotate phosphoribosyltransferase [Actinomycetota bacterium]
MTDGDVSRLARPRRGHFDLGTGYHGDLWLDLDALFLWPDRLGPAVGQLARELRGYRLDAVSGPLTGGAFLAQQLAGLLGTAFLPAHPAAGSQPGFRVAAGLRKGISGWREVVADDAVNAGTAVLATCEELRGAGAVPVAVAALLALGPARARLAGTLGLPFHAVSALASEAWPAGKCALCASGVPIGQPPA